MADAPVSDAALTRHCAGCNKTDADGVSLSICSRCKAAHYCSVDCQAKDWKAGHKKMCKKKDSGKAEATGGTGKSTSRRCASCDSDKSVNGSSLSACGNCKKVFYCSVACQATAWKNGHQTTCKAHKADDIYGDWSPDGWPEQRMPARLPPHNAHLKVNTKGINTDNLLHNFDQETTYKLLIESYRCWDDTKRFGVVSMAGKSLAEGLKYMDKYSFASLQRFIDQAEKKSQSLPEWWDADDRAACEDLAIALYHWNDIETTVPVEVNVPNRYGNRLLRGMMREVGCYIEDISVDEAASRGWAILEEKDGLFTHLYPGGKYFATKTSEGVWVGDMSMVLVPPSGK